MSTITSPRLSLSINSPTATSSSRPSLETSRTASPARPPQRRNRAALREYYNLKAPLTPADNNADSDNNNNNNNTISFAQATADSHQSSDQNPESTSGNSELDAPDFDAEKWVQNKFETEGLEGLLKCEASLIGEIRGLDGERKALVYDNYSKLIRATETIKRMRANMDPLTPATMTLEKSVARIAGMAEGIAGAAAVAAAARDSRSGGGQGEEMNEAEMQSLERKQQQQAAVRWVLGTPSRLKSLRDDGKQEEAAGDWEEVKSLLQEWEGVRGVNEVRDQCECLMEQ